MSGSTASANSNAVGGSIGNASASSTTDGGVANGSRCVDLALEGERRCRSGDTKTGVSYLEAALTAGTDDLRTLSAIYSQLGNAYFYMGDYIKALEYHRHDVTLARTIGDRAGEAKASGNLGNTLKVLGKHDEAIVCCQRHLDISRELQDKVGESRALYNLGNVYHAKGKHVGRLSHYEAGEYPQEVRNCLQKAVEYYELNLQIVQELSDRAAEGRSCGNLGNTYYLLGEFRQAVRYHLQRLNIAKQFGDKPAMRRAYSNLGNAHVFLGEFEQAVECYKQALAIAIELGDFATEAQACYSLGNTSTLLGEHLQAVEYHLRHLTIARQLKDRVGQARASWSLGNAFTSLGEHSKAMYFVMVHLQLSREIGDQNGELIAEQNLSDLSQILGPSVCSDNSADPEPLTIDQTEINQLKVQRRNLEKRDVTRTLSDKTSPKPSTTAGKPISLSVASRRDSTLSVNNIRPQLLGNTPEDMLDEDSFFDLLSRAQSKRMDDQRCDPKALQDNKENRPRVRASDAPRDVSPSCSSFSSRSISSLKSFRKLHYSTLSLKRFKSRLNNKFRSSNKNNSCPRPLSCSANNVSYRSSSLIHSGELVRREQGPEEFLDLVVGMQSRRMDDQRAALPFLPGLQHPDKVLGPHLVRRNSEHNCSVPNGDLVAGQFNAHHRSSSVQQLDNDFIEMLIRCQSTRLDEQRSELPKTAKPVAVTVPDDDFFQQILKVQARRFEEQRANLATESTEDGNKDNKSESSSSSPSGEKMPHKRTASEKIKKR